MTVFSEPNNLGDVLKYEAPNLYSREEITVEAGQKLTLGTVLGRDTDSDALKALNPTATNGTETAIGVLFADVDTTAGPIDSVMITRDAILADHAIIWPPNITPEQKKTAIQQLEARGVLIRQGV